MFAEVLKKTTKRHEDIAKVLTSTNHPLVGVVCYLITVGKKLVQNVSFLKKNHFTLQYKSR